MSVNADLLIKASRLDSLLSLSLETLEQIAYTPRNKGAKRNAYATLMFIKTQREALISNQEYATMQRQDLKPNEQE